MHILHAPDWLLAKVLCVALIFAPSVAVRPASDEATDVKKEPIMHTSAVKSIFFLICSVKLRNTEQLKQNKLRNCWLRFRTMRPEPSSQLLEIL